MPQPAKVTSIEAVDEFKADLVVYLDKARRILDNFSGELIRTRIWLQTDRQLHWKTVVRQRTRVLAQAEQELLTARLSGMPEAIKTRRMAVNKARLALREAEEGLERVKQWLRQYETRVESRAKALMQLGHTLAHDMSKAVAFLEGSASTLAAYAEVSSPALSTPRMPADTSGAAHPQDLANEPSIPGAGT